jgi:hypothetical protein
MEMIYQLPEDAVYAKSGSYIIRLYSDGTFKVFKVNGLYLLSKLLPIESGILGDEKLGFVDEKAVSASSAPILYYMVDAFAQNFGTQQAARAAIQNNALGEALQNQYIQVDFFLRDNSTVFSR